MHNSTAVDSRGGGGGGGASDASTVAVAAAVPVVPVVAADAEACDGVTTMELVMVRGPASLPRCLRVCIPHNRPPITIGRSPECTVVLDPLLVFASHVQCSVYGIAPPRLIDDDDDDAHPLAAHSTEEQQQSSADTQTPARTTHKGMPSDNNDNDHHHTSNGSGNATRGDEAAAAEAVQLYITDLCSSNGTFVNGVRIGATEATPLHDRDVCIFGGMRDVAVGCALPADAFDSPGLVVWRVRLGNGGGGDGPTGGAQRNNDDDEAYALDATPLIFPSAEALHRQEQVLLDTVRRSLHMAQCSVAEVHPDRHHNRSSSSSSSASDKEDGKATVLSVLYAHDEQHVQHTADSNVAALCDRHRSHSNGRQRSVSLVSPLSEAAPATTDDAQPSPTQRPPPPQQQQQQQQQQQLLPPHCVCFRVVRLGRYRCTVSDDVRCQQQQQQQRQQQQEQQQQQQPPQEDDAATTAAVRQRTRRPQRKRTRAADLVTATAPPPSPPCSVSFTPTHWHWTMTGDPNACARNSGGDVDAGSSSASPSVSSPSSSSLSSLFHCMLPVGSIATALACVARCGLAVEVREGCHVPLVAPAILQGGVEQRWIVWQLCPPPPPPPPQQQQHRHDDDEHGEDGGDKENATMLVQAGDDARKTADTYAREWFVRWLAQLAAYYAPHTVPPPHPIDADVFDKLLTPHTATS